LTDTNFPRTNGAPARPAGEEDKQKARIYTKVKGERIKNKE